MGYGWSGLTASAGTLAPILQRLNVETNAALADAGIRNKAHAVSLQLRGGMATQFTEFIISETRKWQQVIEAANISAE